MVMKEINRWSKRIYDLSNPREKRRQVIFLLRSLFHQTELRKILAFFADTAFKQDWLRQVPFFIEQVTRQFFYKDSTFSERQQMICYHVDYLCRRMEENAIRTIYDAQGPGMVLWQEDYQDKKLALILKFEPGQKKEGLLSVILQLGEDHLYQMIFWIAPGLQGGEPALWIGAMQGSNAETAPDIIKGLTKHFFGYRTKNLILYATRAVAKALDLEAMYAVSNLGYYANNHLRLDRKLKTSLDDFWQETDGKQTADGRFYELPVVEYRKTIEEVKTHKRNQYRKRFAALDAVEASIMQAIEKCIRK